MAALRDDECTRIFGDLSSRLRSCDLARPGGGTDDTTGMGSSPSSWRAIDNAVVMRRGKSRNALERRGA